MGKESKWQRIKIGFCSLPPDRVKLAVNSKKKQTAGSKWAKSQNGPRVKIGFCSLPPDRVKLAVNSKKKQIAGSKWAKSQNGPMVVMGPERVKMGQRSLWAAVVYPLTE